MTSQGRELGVLCWRRTTIEGVEMYLEENGERGGGCASCLHQGSQVE